MNKVIGVIAGLAALSFASMANAAIVTAGTIGDGFASIGGNNLVPGELPANGSIAVESDVELTRFSASVIDNSTQPPNILDLSIEFFSDAAMTVSLGVLDVTDSAGLQLNFSNGKTTQYFDLASVAGASLYFAISGTPVPLANCSGDGCFPDFNVQVAAVPVPAALPLLLSGLAGLGFAARRRKAA